MLLFLLEKTKLEVKPQSADFVPTPSLKVEEII